MAGSIIAKTLSQDVISETVQPLYIGGVNPNGSDAKLTVNTDGTMTGASALSLPSLTVASKPVMSSLLASYTVTGSAVTSIDFSGLDLNAHKSYRVEFNIRNTSGSNSDYYLFLNNYTTLTGYYTQKLNANHTTISGSRLNSTLFANAVNNYHACGFIFINRADWISAVSVSQKNLGSLVEFENYSISSSGNNVTQLTLTASVANAMAVGSTIRIYRGDV